MPNTISDQAVFGAQVVSTTLDYMNGGSGSNWWCNSSEGIGAQVVSKTLDYLNSDFGKSGKKSNCQGSISDSYNFNKDVLSAHYLGKGAIASART